MNQEKLAKLKKNKLENKFEKNSQINKYIIK